MWDVRDPLALAGGALILGGVVFFSAFPLAVTTPRLTHAADGPVAERLAAVHAHTREWRRITLSFNAGVAVTLVGLAFAASALAATAGGGFALGAALAYATGTACMIASLAVRMAIDPAAAEEHAATGTPPGWFTPLDLWSQRLYQYYMHLAFSAIALFGAGLVLADAAPAWLAWSSLAFGALWAVMFALGRPNLGGLALADLPLWIHVWGLVAGVTLLVMAYPDG